jgi:hypothetical protein
MQSMTLREAARRSSRSVTTLRRYIRSGRLAAQKRRGRFGPEYFVSERALAEAGLEPGPREDAGDLVRRPTRAPATTTDPAPSEPTVPVSLFQELQMKHEQLLVQYGMVRVGGMRVLELRSELEAKRRELEASEARIARLRRKFRDETSRLKQLLRRVELEQQGRGLEVAALREKVRGLEMLTRNSATNATIERQFSDVMEQMRRIDHLTGQRASSPAKKDGGPWPPAPADEMDH